MPCRKASKRGRERPCGARNPTRGILPVCCASEGKSKTLSARVMAATTRIDTGIFFREQKLALWRQEEAILASSSRSAVWSNAHKKKEPQAPSGTWGSSTLAMSYSRTTYRCTTIGAAAFHFRVRNGNGWCHCAMITRRLVKPKSARWGEVWGRSHLNFTRKSSDYFLRLSSGSWGSPIARLRLRNSCEKNSGCSLKPAYR